MIDSNKPLTTQGGHDVRDVHFLSKPVSGYEWMGLCQVADSGAWQTVLWTFEGSCQGLSDAYDLINEPEEIEVWVNVFLSGPPHKRPHTTSHHSEYTARAAVGHNSHLEYLATAYPVKIPLGYGVEK